MKSPPPPPAPALQSAAARVPPANDLVRDLDLLIRSRYSLIFLRTHEDERAEVLIHYLAERLEVPFFIWNRIAGLRRFEQPDSVYQTAPLSAALAHLASIKRPVLSLLKLFAGDLENPELVERLRETGRPLERTTGAIVLCGADLEVPPALRSSATLVELPEPQSGDYQRLLQLILRDLSERQNVRYDLNTEELQTLLAGLRGLTLLEAEKILTKAIVEDGVLAAEDMRFVLDSKREIVEREGVLEYTPWDESLSEIAGLNALKQWLHQRRQILLEPERAEAMGLDFPKGLLLVGVPGCGKSLCAKVVARQWKLPLLRLDTSALYNKYIGETEKNFARAMKTAERVAPVVLWIDEIEKAFAGSQGGDDGGVSKRVLGSFLSWLQERRGSVFVVATANDVGSLPPELMRKGRFDEIFFVDLPDAETRHEIWRLHLDSRSVDAAALDLDRLAELTEGFSGAEIEQAVVAASFSALTECSEVSAEHLEKEVRATHPMSETLAERIEQLRHWARGRVRSAR